jgi:hypothetical protein
VLGWTLHRACRRHDVVDRGAVDGRVELDDRAQLDHHADDASGARSSDAGVRR